MPSEQLEMIVAMLSSGGPFTPGASFAEQRANLDAQAGAAPLADGTVVEPTNAGGVPAEWLTAPGARDDAAMLYLHGGGYCVGSVVSHRGHASRLSAACGLRVLNLGYRLAPEHPFPAAIDDAVAAYRWLRSRGVAANRIVIAGDSAGGGLTLATLLALRDAREPLPAAGVCISPWTDLALTGATMDTKDAEDPMCHRVTLAPMAAAYLGDADARTPLASPLYADPRGLPPLLIHVGTRETLLDDSLRLADGARRAGVDVTCEAWEEMIHVFHAFAPLLPEADQAIAKVAEFVRARIAA